MGAAISLAVSDLGQPSCYSQSPEQGVGWGMISGGQRFGSSPRAEIQGPQMTAETTAVAEGC